MVCSKGAAFPRLSPVQYLILTLSIIWQAQMMASEYKKRGGSYTTDKETGQDESQKHLSNWTDEEWQTREGVANATKDDGTKKRYLPKKAWENMSDEEKEETEKKKEEGEKEGKQYVGNTGKAKEERRRASKGQVEGEEGEAATKKGKNSGKQSKSKGADKKKEGEQDGEDEDSVYEEEDGADDEEEKDGDFVEDAEANQEDEEEDEDVGHDNKDEPHGQKRVNPRQDDKTGNKKQKTNGEEDGEEE